LGGHEEASGHGFTAGGREERADDRAGFADSSFSKTRGYPKGAAPLVTVLSEAEGEKGRQGRLFAGLLEGACPSKGSHGETGVPQNPFSREPRSL
jgi:hypothetical protein